MLKKKKKKKKQTIANANNCEVAAYVQKTSTIANANNNIGDKNVELV